MELFIAGCSVTWSKRMASCYLVDKHILFDCGEGTINNLFRCFDESVVNGIDYIFLTHFHSDHLFGITPYIAKMVNSSTLPQKKLTVVGGAGLRKIIEFMVPNHISGCEVNIDDYLNLIEITDYSTQIKVDNYIVKPFKLNHGYIDDTGYLICTNEGVLGYTGDAIFNDALVAFASKCDAMLCDTSDFKNSYSHNGVEGYMELKKRFPKLNLYAVHCRDAVFSDAEKLGLKLVKELETYNFKGGDLVKV